MNNENEKKPIVVSEDKTNQAVSIDSTGLNVKKGGNVFIGTLNVVVSPTKKRWEKHYHPKHNPKWHWHLTLDTFLTAVLIILSLVNVVFYWENKEAITLSPYNNQNNPSYTEVINAKLSMSLTSDGQFIKPGNNNNYKLEYKNENSFSLKNVEIIANINSQFTKDNIINWSSGDLPQLTEIKPGATGEISFSISNSVNPLTKTNPAKSTVSVTALFSTSDTNETRGFSTSNYIIQTIPEDISVSAFGRYYTNEGDQLGIGPLPPVVDIPTRYWAIFRVQKSYGNASEIMLTATLPSNVSWTGRTSTVLGESVIIDPTTNKLRWAVIIPEGANRAETAIELELTPTANQTGNIANLVTNISTTAIGAISKQEISKITSNITTNLTHDPLENSGGIVVVQ